MEPNRDKTLLYGHEYGQLKVGPLQLAQQSEGMNISYEYSRSLITLGHLLCEVAVGCTVCKRMEI